MTPSSGDVLRPISAFLSDALSQPDHRRVILSSASRKSPSPSPPTLQALTLLSQALENPSSSSFPSLLRSAEKLLLSLPSPTPLSTLLLALALALRARHVAAALSVLDLFLLDPSAARNDIAPPVFEDLFLPHLMPAVQQFSDRRSRILMQSSRGRDLRGYEEEEDMRSMEGAATPMRGLSRMSGGQAEELRELERRYEDVLDENSRVYAEYLKEILENTGGKAISPPKLVSSRIGGGREGFQGLEEGGESGTGLSDGRYNNVISFPCGFHVPFYSNFSLA